MTIIDEARTVIVHKGAGPLPDGVLRLLDTWLPGRRWYPVPGDGVRHVPWLTMELPGPAESPGADGPEGGPAVVVPLLHLAGPGLAGDEGALVIQVPLVLERVGAVDRPGGAPASTAGPAGEEPAGDGPIGVGPAGDGPIGVVPTDDGYIAVYDGGTHPAAWLAYLRAALPEYFLHSATPTAPSARSVPAAHSLPVTRSARGDGTHQPPVPRGPGPEARAGASGEEWLGGARALGGEQSNSSVLVPGLRVPVPGCPGEHADGVMLKILRTVPAGPHPDVVIPEALTRAGWDGVPRYLGAVELSVPPSEGEPGSSSPGPDLLGADGTHAHLAVVSELITDADDGFELACAYAQEGLAFDERAAELGSVVAHMHTALQAARPTDATLDASSFMGVLRRRAAEAISDVAALAPYRAGITAFYDEVSRHLAHVTTEYPVPLQAIHGDLHLGQVLHAVSGWKVLDFEGEPQRPVAERTAPDLPLRDVAGLLRSFDYAAAVGEAADPEWSERAQVSFLEGYRQALGEAAGAAGDGSPQVHGDAVPGAAVPGAAVPGGALDVTTASLLLRALTLDKALYEVVYEARHRPGWLHIPLNAVARVLDR
ncbi:aminoglycoside phosphotransferase [Myceligenerans indicum]|uniref:Aminoglycoside phosphotransferase n=1 Tax=Myceligenerans indicum TaxID=2593663 RepID=A0ABS1LK97_9MICO|nr:aminoglycoside phosphotransferase [Myceligenerans indicum]MBL0886627.1 aminoglycoside phosphotransferase [Myceligenerans indicum]